MTFNKLISPFRVHHPGTEKCIIPFHKVQFSVKPDGFPGEILIIRVMTNAWKLNFFIVNSLVKLTIVSFLVYLTILETFLPYALITTMNELIYSIQGVQFIQSAGQRQVF